MCEAVSAYGKPDLSNTKVTIPWKTFDQLRQNKKDTIFVDSSESNSSKILFNKASLTVTVKDSLALCSVQLDYVVMNNGKWVSKAFVEKNEAVALSKIVCPEGDVVISTDSGFVVATESRNNLKEKRLSYEWYMVSHVENGVYSLSLPLPEASQCKITLRLPSDYTDISISDFPFLADKTVSGKKEMTWIVPSDSKVAELQYVRPVQTSDEDQDSSTDLPESVTESRSKISTVQQNILSVNNGTITCLTALTINPVRISLTSFTITVPEHYTLLRIEGNGIQKWTEISKNTFLIRLSFKMESPYTAVFVTETESDSGGSVPYLDFKGSAHQSGSFIFSLKGSDEVQMERMGNCIVSSGSELRNINLVLLQTIEKMIKEGVTSVNNISTLHNGSPAFSFYKTPLDANFKVIHHTTIPVENAITDSSEITSCLTDDWKLITQVTWYVSQRDRKYLSIALPDSCDIWQINVNGKERSPLMDEKGKVRISLHQNRYDGNEREQLKITAVYFKKCAPANRLLLRAPTPDIPVSKLSWIVFYSKKLNVSEIKGDFQITTGTFFKRRNQMETSESEYHYKSVLKSGREQQIPLLLDDSPKHIYGKKVLVVDEQPVMELHIADSSYLKMVIMISLGVLIPGIVTFLLWFNRFRKK
jgi:hypothetical protein